MLGVLIKISGRVQGVGFRFNLIKQATKIGLKGFVRNLDDGSVEVRAYGSKEGLKKIVDWCYNGSRLAKVSKVKSHYFNFNSTKEEFWDGFFIKD